MASKRRQIDDGPIIPAAPPSLEQFCPDLAPWPDSWCITESDIDIGQRVVDTIKPFLTELVQSGLAHNTLTRHRDHLRMLGGEIIRRRYEDPDLAKRPVHDLLFDLIEEDGGPLIWPRITESEQNSFDATCRKLYHFLAKAKPALER